MCVCVRARSLMAATLPTSWSAAVWGPGGVKHGRVTSVLVHSQVIKMIREELASRWFISNYLRNTPLIISLPRPRPYEARAEDG